MLAKPRTIEYKPPDPIELQKAREKRYKEKKMWDILREVRLLTYLKKSNYNFNLHRVPTQTGKPGKMEKLFPVREKSGNFVQTGKVREIWTKYWKSQGNLENFYFLCYF